MHSPPPGQVTLLGWSATPTATRAGCSAPRPRASGKSLFPANAGYWGRIDTRGRFVKAIQDGVFPARGQWRERAARAGKLIPLILAALIGAAVPLLMLRAPIQPPPIVLAPPAPYPVLSPLPALQLRSPHLELSPIQTGPKATAPRVVRTRAYKIANTASVRPLKQDDDGVLAPSFR